MADPTAALLWAACRPELDVAAVRAAADAGADLAAATDLAIAQRVSPLLWRGLHAAGRTDPAAAWVSRLRGDGARCHAQSRMVLPRMGELALAPLAAAGLEALVIKGGALVDRYPDLGLRPMDDIDLVLPAAHVERAANVLVAAGWTRRDATARQRHEVQLFHASLPGLHLDLHRSLGTWRNRSNGLTTECLWSARRATTLFGAPAFALTTDVELVMLAAHAGKPWHAYDRLIWVVDLAIVVTAGAPDWDNVARFATAARARSALAVGLTQAMHLGAESPPELRHIDAPWRAHALAPLLSHDWPAMVHSRNSRATMRYALVDDRRTRLRLMAGEVLSTTPAAAPRRAYWMARRRWQQYRARRSEFS